METKPAQMTQTVHRILMTIGGVASGIGGLLAVATPQGMDPLVGAYIALIGGAATIAANTWRSVWGTAPATP